MTPSIYADRRKLSTGARRAFDGAADAWADLSATMQAKLIECWPDGKRDNTAYLPQPTYLALYDRGICDESGLDLEPLGLLVRQVGTRTKAST